MNVFVCNVFACKTCMRAVHVKGEVEEIRALLGEASSFPCTTPLCRGRMEPLSGNADWSVFRHSEVELKGFFRAVNGFGPAKGAPATVKRLWEVLTTQRVVDIVATEVGQPERVILNELVMEDGTRLHFETSARGACVYYIEEARDGRSSGESPHTNREEVGRDLEAPLEPDQGPVQDTVPAVSDSLEQSVSGSVSGLPQADHVPGSRPGDDPEVSGSPVRV